MSFCKCTFGNHLGPVVHDEQICKKRTAVDFLKRSPFRLSSLSLPQSMHYINLLASTSSSLSTNKQHLAWLQEDRIYEMCVGLYGKRLCKYSPTPTTGKYSLATDFNRTNIHHLLNSLFLSKNVFLKSC